MSTTNRPSTRKAFTNNRMVPGRFKHLCFFSKTNRAVFLLAVLIVLLSGCSGGSGGSGSPDPTAVGSDGSTEQPRALPFLLHDFDLFVLAGGFLVPPGSLLEGHIKVSSPEHAAIRVAQSAVRVYDRPCRSGSATFTPFDESGIDFHYTADKCYYPEEEAEPWKASQSDVFFDGIYKNTFGGQDANNTESFYELDRFFAKEGVDSASDPRIPPQDFRPLLSGTLHTTKAEDEAEVFTSTSTIDELTIHGHGSLRNYSSVHKSDSEGLVSYAVNYDITQIVRDPVVLEGFNHQLVLFGDLMLGSGVANPGNPKEINLINGTYEAQIRTPETIIYGDEKSPISGAYTFNLVSHNISAEIRYFDGGYDVIYTNNGETQTKTVQF